MHRLEVKKVRAFETARGERDKTTRHHWWPVAYSRAVRDDVTKPVAVTLFGEPLVLFQAEDGAIQCVADVCAHNSAALSQGFVEGGQLVCRYHGWRYAKGGTCAHPPELSGKKATTLYSYPVVDDGLVIWIFPTHDEPVEFVNPLVDFTRRAGVEVSAYRTREFDFHQPWELWAASFIDSSHRAFAHPKTITPSQQDSTSEYFDLGLTPSATGVDARHDRILGFFTYLLFSPVSENRHKQFLTIFPTSQILPFSVSYRLFSALRLPQMVASIAYEDYFLIVKQAERIAQGASKWGIRGKYGSPESDQFIDWHIGKEKDDVWFDGYSSEGKPKLRPALPARRRLDVVDDSVVNDSGFDLGPYSGKDRALRAPTTWDRLQPFDQAVKKVVSWVSR